MEGIRGRFLKLYIFSCSIFHFTFSRAIRYNIIIIGELYG